MVSILEPEIGESNFVSSHAKHQRVTGTDMSLSNTVNVQDNQQGKQSCMDRLIWYNIILPFQCNIILTFIDKLLFKNYSYTVWKDNAIYKIKES